METKIDEIAPDIYRLSTWIEDVAPPAGFTFNQFLVRAEQPFLFHTGMRQLYPARLRRRRPGRRPPSTLRWISFGHVEADECGAMNQFLAAAPDAAVVHGELACAVSLNDLADRPPRPMTATRCSTSEASGCASSPPPRAAQLGERSLVRGDHATLLRRRRVHPSATARRSRATTWSSAAADAARTPSTATSMGPDLVPTLHRLADLEPTTLAVMHGSSYHGDGADQLRSLADSYDERLAAVLV